MPGALYSFNLIIQGKTKIPQEYHIEGILSSRGENMKVLSVVGTRPNFVKMAPIVREILKRDINHILVHTGQHYDRELSKIFLSELKMPKLDYFLDVGSGSHGYQTGEMLRKLEEVILKEKPDFAMIPGDTNTSLAGALASSKVLEVITCHIESGLRSFDRTMPEEINRILIDHCSDALFCPTKTAVENLRREGVPDERIHLVGDTMVEACLEHKELASSMNFHTKYPQENEYFLATVHRAENTNSQSRLNGIIEALLNLDKDVIFPIHPRTQKKLTEFGLMDKVKDSSKIKLMSPIGYLEFLFLLANCRLMITDSGGIQKEAFLLKVPCVTLRDNTEWVETLSSGANVLVGAESKKIIDGVNRMLTSKIDFDSNPFGDGNASKIIVDIIMDRKGGVISP
jgi:UDP-N-acetylglucosamine 2-epimerase (non-hydrolysing)